MRILQITKKFPYPLLDGEAWAVNAMAKGLIDAGVKMDLFSLNTHQHHTDIELVEHYKGIGPYNNITLAEHKPEATLITGFFNLFSSKSFHEERFESNQITHQVNKLLDKKKYDVVLAESIFVMLYLSDVLKTKPELKVILRAHNVESLIWSRYAKRKGRLKKWYFNVQSDRLQKFELEQFSKSDAILTLSQKDSSVIANSIDQAPRLEVVPIGIDISSIHKLKRGTRPFILGFIGSLDWRPNQEGLLYFLDNIWPHITEEDEDVLLMIAGRNPKHLKNIKKHDQVTFLGEIEDSDSFMAQIDGLIVPLWSGSGTRVKILQALSFGTPVIATSLAVEGLDIQDGMHFLEVECIEDWQNSIKKIQADMDFCERLSDNGKRYLKENHDIGKCGVIAKKFIETI